MYNQIMKQRMIAATLLFCTALSMLLLRYAPPWTRLIELGDPLDVPVLTGFYLPEYLDGLIMRRTSADATLHLALADGRGAQSFALWLRSGTPAPQLVRLRYGPTIVIRAVPTLRSYHLLAPPQPSRSLSLALEHATAAPSAAESLNLLVDRALVRGRAGWPAPADLLALLALALLPVLLLATCARLPLDWALVAGMLCLVLLALLPAADRPALLTFGPLVALLVGLMVLLPPTRAYPAITLVALGGAVLRCYGLGWGSGLIVHPDEQTLVDRALAGWPSQLLYQLAALAAQISGRAAWLEPWGIVLIGRVWAALCGSALIVAVYALGCQLLRPRWALLAAAFVAVTPLLVQQSHIATSALLDALLIVLLLLCHTLAAGRLRARWLIGGAALTLLLATAQPTTWPLPLALLIAPMVAQPALWSLLRRRTRPHGPRWLALASCLLALVIGAGLAYWSVTSLTLRELSPALAADQQLRQTDVAQPELAVSANRAAARSGALVLEPRARLAAIVVSFTALTWGLGPLLVQIGLVGWGAGVFASLRQRKQRWRPLLAGMGAYLALIGLGVADETIDLSGRALTAATLRSLTPLVPLLCLTAALLLQFFGLRLREGLGRRSVRLLAGTALCLALAVALGTLTIYRQPDTRVAASRWLLRHAAPQQVVLQDVSLREQLPLGLTHLFTSVALPTTAADPARLDQAVAVLRRADYIVLTAERTDIDLARLRQTDPLRACYYRALFDGRLGFVPRASFSVTPQLAGWTIDDGRSDPRLRVYDHPPVRIFQRIASPTPAALTLLLRCDETAR